MHKSEEFVHGKGNIRLSHPKMLEATDHLTIPSGIHQRSTIIRSQGNTHNKQCRDRFEAQHVMFAEKINDILLLR